ncbi:MAG: UbiA family prenyltransferase [Gammaproteobacteria bacterium]|nr:MAG: UbiA family prenyltransferase [Gammaproteobacteria bacterium]
MTFADALSLGRVSNLPTVWTNMLTGVVLAGGTLDDTRAWLLLAALTLFYVAGMYLNDAFDADIDAVERPQRPIPAGRVSGRTVFAAGCTMLAVAIALMAAAGSVGARFDDTGPWPGLAGLALAGVIVFYDRHHKNNPLSPVLMGISRMLVYIGAAVVFVVPLPRPLTIAAVVLLCYLIGLTYVAKQENLGRVRNMWPLAFLAVPGLYGLMLIVDAPWAAPFWIAFSGWVLVALFYLGRRNPGDIPRAVVSLIAGIALLDALLIAAAGATGYALLAVLGFLLTLGLQRFIAGT